MNRNNFPIDLFYTFRDTLLKIGILKIKNDKCYRISMWKVHWNNQLQATFDILTSYLTSTEELWHCLKTAILPITDSFKCPVCKTDYVKFTGKGWRSTCINCSPNCVPNKKPTKKFTETQKQEIKKKKQQTLLERYGDPHYNNMAKNKATRLKHYGNENYVNTEKIKQTCLERYGVTTNLILPEVQSKNRSQEAIQKAIKTREQTCLQKYGKKYAMQVESIKKKNNDARKKHRQQYAQENDCTLFADLLKQYGQGWLHLENIPRIYYNHNTYIPNSFIPTIEKYSNEGCHTNKYTSKGEKEVAEFIKSLNVDIEENNTNTVSNRNGRFYELDIYIPSKRVAFDFNGMYWHSTLYKDKNYHKRKSDYCREDGIRLIHIFEDYWIYKQDIYKSIIKSALGIYDNRIYARKCQVTSLNADEYEQFLENNHLHGAVHSPIRFGLIYNGQLVQVIGLGKSRFTNEMELHRMCTLKNTQVIGGFSKLIKHCGIDEFISYVDLSVYDGKAYKNIGFKMLGQTVPGYFYSKDNIRYNRIQFQKKMLPNKLKYFNADLSESENMINNGYLQIYDAGNLKLQYNINFIF